MQGLFQNAVSGEAQFVAPEDLVYVDSDGGRVKAEPLSILGVAMATVRDKDKE